MFISRCGGTTRVPYSLSWMIPTTMERYREGLHACITGDIDYFDTETIDCLRSYFLVLKRHGVPGTFFITARAAGECPERVEFILKNGYDVQGHGDVHEAFTGSVTKQAARLREMNRVFSDRFGITIQGFRAPWYRHTTETYPALLKAGLKYDCSVKRFEIAFKGIPYIERRYLDAPGYRLVKPVLRCIGDAYNAFHRVPRGPYYVIPALLEIPTLGISDYSLIGDPKGPRYLPGDAGKIGDVWIECLKELKNRGGGTLNIQAHPGRLSPSYVEGLDRFITEAIRLGTRFTSPAEISREFAVISPGT